MAGELFAMVDYRLRIMTFPTTVPYSTVFFFLVCFWYNLHQQFHSLAYAWEMADGICKCPHGWLGLRRAGSGGLVAFVNVSRI